MTYSVSAVDAVNGTVPVFCSTASGTKFAVGTTTVYCGSIDAAFNIAVNSFTVTVKKN